MSKLMAAFLASLVLFGSLPCLADETPAAGTPGEAAQPAPALATPVPQPDATPPVPESKPPLRKSVIGRPLVGNSALVPPAPAAGFPIPVFVDDERTLAALVSEDKELVPAAENLAARRSFLGYYTPTAALVSAGLLLMGSLMRADEGEWNKTNAGLTIGGGGFLVLSAIVVGAVYPTRSENLDIINAWNHAHPDRPIFP